MREFVDATFGRVGLDADEHVAFDERYLRPTEVDLLRGDSSKAQRVLDWSPQVDFDGLVDMMVAADLKIADQEKLLADAGHPQVTMGQRP